MLKSHLRITIFLNNQLNDTQKNKIVFKKTQKTIFKIRLSSTYFLCKVLVSNDVSNASLDTEINSRVCKMSSVGFSSGCNVLV